MTQKYIPHNMYLQRNSCFTLRFSFISSHLLVRVTRPHRVQRHNNRPQLHYSFLHHYLTPTQRDDHNGKHYSCFGITAAPAINDLQLWEDCFTLFLITFMKCVTTRPCCGTSLDREWNPPFHPPKTSFILLITLQTIPKASSVITKKKASMALSTLIQFSC